MFDNIWMTTDYVRYCSTTSRLRSTLFNDDPTTFDIVRRRPDYFRDDIPTTFDDIPTTFDNDVRRHPTTFNIVRRRPYFRRCFNYVRRCPHIFDNVYQPIVGLCQAFSGTVGHCRALPCWASSITPFSIIFLRVGTSVFI